MDNIKIPIENKPIYLGMTLDTNLKWKDHVKNNREKLNTKWKNIKGQ